MIDGSDASAMLIDSHCHLTAPGLHSQVARVIERAQAVGVGEFVTIATDLDDADRAVEIRNSNPCVQVAAGIHPHEAGKAPAGWDSRLAKLVAGPQIVAVGEMGLDYHYDFSDRATQHSVFQRQLEIAGEVAKPIVIHCREAHADVMKILRALSPVAGVVFHCFTGTLEEAREILDAGYWLSLTGVVTFKKSQMLRDVAKLIPDDRLMVETDSPYLSPEPVRSMRPNEPANLVHTARCIAEVRGSSLEALSQLATANTRRFFRLPASCA